MKDILENPDKPWNWDNISLHSNITMKDILENPDKPWNWENISENPNLTTQFVRNHLDKSWDWKEVERNLGMSRQDILDTNGAYYGAYSDLSKGTITVNECLAIMCGE